MTTNINPNLSATKNGAPPRIPLTVTFASGTFTVKKSGGTTLLTSATSKGLHSAALAAYREQGPYDNSAWVDFYMPLNNGGSYVEPYMIEFGLVVSTQYYNADGTTGFGPQPPSNTILPAISGTAQVGQTLTTTNGTWANGTTGFAYQWFRGGSAISGATSSSYALVTADLAALITVRVTATNANGSTPATSPSVGPVAASGGGPTFQQAADALRTNFTNTAATTAEEILDTNSTVGSL